METNEPHVINMQQCGDALGISTQQLFKLMDDGKVPYYKPSKRVFFFWPDVRDALLTSK